MMRDVNILTREEYLQLDRAIAHKNRMMNAGHESYLSAARVFIDSYNPKHVMHEAHLAQCFTRALRHLYEETNEVPR